MKLSWTNGDEPNWAGKVVINLGRIYLYWSQNRISKFLSRKSRAGHFRNHYREPINFYPIKTVLWQMGVHERKSFSISYAAVETFSRIQKPPKYSVWLSSIFFTLSNPPCFDFLWWENRENTLLFYIRHLGDWEAHFSWHVIYEDAALNLSFTHALACAGPIMIKRPASSCFNEFFFS